MATQKVITYPINTKYHLAKQNDNLVVEYPSGGSTLDNGLLHRWKLDQATSSGKVVLDQKGSNNITFTNDLTFVTDHNGVANGAMSGNGGHGVSASNVAISTVPAVDHSFSFWFKSLADNVNGVISWFGGNYALYTFSGTRILFQDLNFTYSLNAWHNLVAVTTADLTKYDVYVDDTFKGQQTLTSQAQGTFWVGDVFGNYYWNSNLLESDIRIWNRRLTSAEITELYTST